MSLDLRTIALCTHAGKPLFAPLSLTIAAGQIGAVMGPSGAGKSTLLAAIAGHLSSPLAQPFSLSGQVVLNGVLMNDLAPQARRIGLMFQDAALFPHLSLGDNLAFALPADIRGRAARRAAVDAALDQAGLAGMAARDPATLSGGERARAALMRSLLARPAAILLDEPFASLDADTRAEIRSFTFSHIRNRAIPALIVSHDPQDAAAAGGPIVQITRQV